VVVYDWELGCRRGCSLFLIVILLLQVASFGASSIPFVHAGADWWDSDWQFRKKISLSFTDPANFTPVLVIMDFGSGKVQSCEKEIRVLDETNTNEIPVNVQTLSESSGFCTQAQIKFEVAANPGIPTIVFVYYGNSAAIQPPYYDVFWDNFNRSDQTCKTATDVHAPNQLGCKIDGQIGNEWTIVHLGDTALGGKEFEIKDGQMVISGTRSNESNCNDDKISVKAMYPFETMASWTVDGTSSRDGPQSLRDGIHWKVGHYTELTNIGGCGLVTDE